MVTYPIDFPTNLGISSYKMGLLNAVGALKSPFTFKKQVIRNSGQAWQIEVGLPNMLREDAEMFNAFILKLDGQWGTFLCGDPNGVNPRGTWGGTPLVKGAAQTGNTLLIDGMTHSITGICKAGDYFQLGTGSSSRLFKLTDDCDSNSSGEVTLKFSPRLRASPADNAALTIINARGVFRMDDNIQPFSINSNSIYNLAFKATEEI